MVFGIRRREIQKEDVGSEKVVDDSVLTNFLAGAVDLERLEHTLRFKLSTQYCAVL